MRAVAVGDSVNWGQGLNPRDKYIPRCVNWLREQGLAEIDLTTADFHPHSGAIIGLSWMQDAPHYLSRNEVSAPSRYNQFFGEVPSATPTVLGQLRNIRDGENVDLLFVNGGPNDVGITDSAGSSDTFDGALATVDHIAEERLPELLRAARNTCPNAIIVYTGYYPALSPASDIPLLMQVAREFNPYAPVMIFMIFPKTWIAGEVIAWSQRNRLKEQGLVFHRRMLARFREQVSAFNEKHGGELGPIIFSPSGIGERNSMWTSGEAVSTPGSDPAPRVTSIREGFCADVARADLDESELIGEVSNQAICDMAYVAHPNVRGANQYFRQLQMRLQHQYRFSLRAHLDGLVEGGSSLRALQKQCPFVPIQRLRGLTDLLFIHVVTVEYKLEVHVSAVGGGARPNSIAFDFGWGYEEIDFTYGQIGTLELGPPRRADDFRRVGVRMVFGSFVQFTIRFDIKINGYPLSSVFLRHDDFRERGEYKFAERRTLPPRRS